ncbi:MAG TPA: sigma-70 family RNA polymerase sigma factor [Puia sp.]|nr:sigma-70 family RNA polymerase sigma factor [Puia sp.]
MPILGGVAFLKNISSNGGSRTSAGSQSGSGSPADSDDHMLIAAYKSSSDLKIVAQLYQRYLELLYGLCLKYLGEAETARDAVMDLFEELAQKLLKHEVTHFKGWLYTLAKNHCLMKLRSAGKARVQSFDPDHMQTADDLHLKEKIQREEQFDQLSACIEALPPDQRTVIRLFYLENKCYKEIETATGMEWNKVRSHIQNGRRNLKICMQQQVATNE